ncbi:MAG: hypothetical protein DHS80DRAFT_29350 [Piptocephalis tieghemiana]|nr:MAG: hypothetical protein DHS80DRAFT_29350 [Piptocephalis tieghemiana]
MKITMMLNLFALVVLALTTTSTAFPSYPMDGFPVQMLNKDPNRITAPPPGDASLKALQNAASKKQHSNSKGSPSIKVHKGFPTKQTHPDPEHGAYQVSRDAINPYN